MKVTLNQRPRGIALIIVLIAVLSLSILAGVYAYSMKVEARLAMNSNNEAEMEWMGRSGVERAKYVLSLEMQAGGVDSLDSFWAGGAGAPGLSNSPLVGFEMKGFALGKGTVSISIEDLERKANINMADDQMIEQALILMGVDAGDYPVIVNSIQDWKDPDDKTRVDGAESDYYATFDPPFEPKNGPLDDLSELLLVKGINEFPEFYYGPSAGNFAPVRLQKNSNPRLGFNADVPTYPVGLVDLFTSISSGRINLNTASAAVLQLIPNVDEHVAQEIVRLRAGPDGQGYVPLNNPGELVNAGIPPNAVQQISRFADVRSRTFQVKVTAQIGNLEKRFVAVVVRNNPRDVQTISFRADE